LTDLNKECRKPKMISPVSNPGHLASTFGPRWLKVAKGYQYDFHRGIDISLPCYTEVRAVADGWVRLSGVYGGYNDRLVQICHPKWGAPEDSCGEDLDGDKYLDDKDNNNVVDRSISFDAAYSNYMHLAKSNVQVGQRVYKRQVIGWSGESGIGSSGNCRPDPKGGFDHLHFEIRDGGIRQKHAVHPLAFLDSTTTSSNAPDVTIISVDSSNPQSPIVKAKVTTNALEPYLKRVQVFVLDRSNNPPSDVCQKGKISSFDMNEWNYHFTPYSVVKRKSDITFLDNPNFHGVLLKPNRFNKNSSSYELEIEFHQLKGVANANNLMVKVRATDIRGLYSEDLWP